MQERYVRLAYSAGSPPDQKPNPSCEGWRTSRLAFGNVFAHDAFVTLQLPLMIRTIGEPIGNPDLPVYLTGGHGDARLLTGGNDFLQAELTVAENSDKSDKHGDLR